MNTFVIKQKNKLCNICIAEHAPYTANTAAGELIRCLSIQAGETLELTIGAPKAGDICVGAKSEGCESDELRLKVEDEILWVDGGKRGVIYAAYELLERLGCRFFAEDCEVIPAKEELILPGNLDVVQKPIFEYRNAFWIGATPKTAPKFRLNSLLGYDIPDVWGGGITYEGFVHTLGYLAEMDKVPCDFGEFGDNQPCLTSEKTYQTVMKNLRAALEKHPDASIASVSQNDSTGKGRGCNCPNCMALNEAEGSYMGSLLPFVNRVAEELEDEYPELAIDTLAYRYTRRIPKTLKARDNVIIRLCSLECCFSHPLDECKTSVLEIDDINFADCLRQWADHSDRIYIWDYTTNYRNYHGSFPNFQVLRKNLRFFADNNVKGVFEQGNQQTINGEFGPLRTYVLSKLLWNPYMSEDEYRRHVIEFMEAYYGAGAPMIQNFMARLIKAVEDVHFGIFYLDPTELFLDLDTEGTRIERAEAFLKKGRSDFAKALKAAETGDQRRRIKLSEIQLDLYEWYLENAKKEETEEGTEARTAAEASVRAAGKKLYAKAISHGITYMNEDDGRVNSFLKEEPDYLTPPYKWGFIPRS